MDLISLYWRSSDIDYPFVTPMAIWLINGPSIPCSFPKCEMEFWLRYRRSANTYFLFILRRQCAFCIDRMLIPL